MAAFTVDWFIGSITIPAQTITVNATPVVIPAGTYYLRHSSASRSLLDVVAAAILAATAIATTITIRRSRQVHILFGGAASVTWGAGTQVRDLLGFTANLGAGVTHLATNISPLLWSPGYIATPPNDIRGSDGYVVPHQAISTSDDGQQSYTYHFGEETHQDLEWSHIDPPRLKTAGTTAAQGGTYNQFHLQCAMLGRRFLYHQDIVEDDTDAATDVSYSTGRGPYMLRPEARSGRWYRRNVQNAEISSSLALPLHMLAEYS